MVVAARIDNGEPLRLCTYVWHPKLPPASTLLSLFLLASIRAQISLLTPVAAAILLFRRRNH
jgi:hypothetical protein